MQIYAELLAKWQKTINLVAPSTLSDVWHRHIADSAQLLDLAPNARAWADLGSGAGKFAAHFAGEGASVCGVDMAPFFLSSAIENVNLVAGDLRRLPFRKGAAQKAYSLDVLEHLDEAGVREVLLEARRAIGPSGRLFVYTHAMESSSIASFQRAVNRLAKTTGSSPVPPHKQAMGYRHERDKFGVAGLTASAGVAGWVEFTLLRRTLNRRIDSQDPE